MSLITRLFLQMTLALVFAFAAPANALQVVYVANTAKSDVSAYSVDATGALTAVPGSPFATGARPYEVAVSPNGAFAYVASSSGTVSAFTVSATGALTPVAGSPFATGSGSSSVAVSPDGAYVYVANRNVSTISAFAIGGTGALTPVAGSPFASASPISLKVSPDGAFVFVAKTGGTVSVFAIGGTGALTQVAGSPFAAGTAPWSIALSPNGAFAYTANLGGSNVSAFTIGGTGALTAVAGSPFPAGSSAYAVTVSPDGAYVYVANASASNVSGYDISGTGVLTPIVGSPFATSAGGFSIKLTADGAFAYVAHANTNTVSAYAVSGTGALTPVAGSPFSLPSGSNPESLTVASIPVAPTATTVAASSIAATASTLNGTVSANGTATTVNFEYGLTTGYGATGSPATAAQSPLASNATGLAVSAAITGLSCNTTYHYRVNASNGVGGTINGSDMSFTTTACVPGAPTIGAASGGNAQAVVTFTAPVSNGGSAVTGYTVTSSPAGGIDSNAGSTSLSHVMTGLVNGTPYTFTVTAANAFGTGAVSAASNSVTPAAPVPPSHTGTSPTGGGNITAVLSGGGATCVFAHSIFIPVSGGAGSPPAGSAPAGVIFPQGLFDFTTTGCTPGSIITLTITYPQALPPGAVYWKYGPTAGTPAAHWYQIPAAIAGSTVVLNITDGGLGDDDLAINGTIVDQGGPGALAAAGIVGVPTLSEWSRILLAGVLAGLGLGMLRRRRTATSGLSPVQHNAR